MAIEIERKFLVKQDLWTAVEKGTGKYYVQGYIPTEPGATVRVRVAGDKAFLTIKGPSKGIAKSEFEYEIPVNDANQLLGELCAQPIIKYRFEVDYNGKRWEVDEFLGDNAGLIVAEIELTHEAETFDLPHWIDQEVSDDKRYSNASLARRPYQSW
ncbi:CYTH domain-containing protein [Paraflavitalea pollutisoli]|uniref:CYTH domain-containing protein n=1 Tax=Paraflavitalea pollutisoli TaxID=3034143 RepID=UPI0023ED231B|nr:CYTH domain-containing protein [Paraflavitalea sp. H1-2-19X]